MINHRLYFEKAINIDSNRLSDIDSTQMGCTFIVSISKPNFSFFVFTFGLPSSSSLTFLNHHEEKLKPSMLQQRLQTKMARCGVNRNTLGSWLSWQHSRSYCYQQRDCSSLNWWYICLYSRRLRCKLVYWNRSTFSKYTKVKRWRQS